MAIQLSFQCDESWDKMPNINQGKFCDKCSKNIHDLTDKSESEIHQLYKKNNGQLCGKIRPQQLKNSIYRQQRTKLAKFCLELFLVFGGYLFKSDLQAQNNAKDSIVVTIDEIRYSNISGTIIEKKGKESVPFASVYYEFKGEKYGTVTEFDGKFNLKIDLNIIKCDNVDLIISSLGYKKMKVKGIKLSKEHNSILNLELEYDIQEITLGMIISCPPIINKDPESHGATIITGDELRRSPY
jgi:hypothetical protein